MKKRNGFLRLTAICLIVILSATGCWNRRELNTLAVVMGVGIDKGEDQGQVQLTAQIVKPGELKTHQAGSGGGGGKAYINIENTGETVFSTIRGFTHKFNQKLYFQHNQILIFSRDIAQEGVEKSIDFFLRDQETRLTVFVLVAKNKAGEILDVQPQLQKIPAIDITNMLESQTATSQTSLVRMNQFVSRLISKTTAPIAPLIEISGANNEKRAYVSGTAVFKKDKLAGQLNDAETRGLLWVLGEVKSGIIDVDCPGGNGKASLEIIRAESKVTPEIKDGKIHITVKIKEEGSLGSQSCSADFTLPTAIEALEKRKVAAIRNEVMAALEKARKLNTDIFGFGDTVHQRYPMLWKEYETRWDEIFPHIEIELSIEAKIRRIGRINKPAYPEKE
ncbi:MAG: Ger(x)C family spore germination protein [Thermincola sp.]|jgi:spore germination protein KC|nr:Ger(x)C family spore germination protein [Thermincola sp.]MDT3702923.1 Ger(x)C family spore germination protein [Thermincola sp.]